MKKNYNQLPLTSSINLCTMTFRPSFSSSSDSSKAFFSIAKLNLASISSSVTLFILQEKYHFYYNHQIINNQFSKNMKYLCALSKSSFFCSSSLIYFSRCSCCCCKSCAFPWNIAQSADCWSSRVLNCSTSVASLVFLCLNSLFVFSACSKEVSNSFSSIWEFSWNSSSSRSTSSFLWH